MRRLLLPLAAVAALSAACGSTSPHPANPELPPPAASPPAASPVRGLADLPQDLDLPPGYRNGWSLDADFALVDGGFDQFQRAVQLHVGRPDPAPSATLLGNELGPGVVAFPRDQAWSELSFTTPLADRAAGLWMRVGMALPGWSGRAIALSGGYGLRAGGSPTPTRMSQAVDLTALAPRTPLTLSWRHAGVILAGRLPAPEPAGLRVVIRDALSGAVLVTAWEGEPLLPGPVAPVDASAAAGSRVTVDFELLGSPLSFVDLDDISLMGSTELLVNGTFEADTPAPWTVSGESLPCQVVSGTRPVGGLQVERQVYARPGLRWARFVDRFSNPGTSAVTTEANYLHELGAATDAVIQARPGGKAITAWDSGPAVPPRRDLAIVQGTSALAPAFRTVGAKGAGDGSPIVWTRFPLTVPAGQTRVIVQFVVLTEFSTGELVNPSAAPWQANHEADAIVAGFWATTTFRDAMTAADLAAVVNF